MKLSNIKDKVNLTEIKKYITIKRVVLIVFATFVIWQSVSTVVLTEGVLNRERFLKSDSSKKIITAEISTEPYISWLEEKSEEVKITDELNALRLQNKASSHSYVIMLHSLTSDVLSVANIAYHFYDIGFNVLIPDYLGKYVSYGVKEQEKLIGCIDYISSSDSEAKIYIFGMGIGATTAMLASDSLGDNVSGIIADSAYVSVKELFKENVKNIYGMSSFPKIALSSFYIKVFHGWSFSEADALESVKKSKIPVLYIHGSEDNVVPIGQSNELFEVTKAEGTDHIRIYGALHGQCVNKDSEKYFFELDDYIRNTMS